MEHLPQMLSRTGFEGVVTGSYHYSERESEYLFSIIDRGADCLVEHETMSEDLGASLKDAARRRARTAEFTGSITYRFALAHKA